MRTLFIVLLFSARLYTSNLLAQSPVTFIPAKPQPGNKVSFTYDPSTTVMAVQGEPKAYAYLLEGGLPVAQEVKLTKTGSLFKGEITTTDTTLAFFLSFEKNGVRDNTKEFGYYSCLYTVDGNPLPGARKEIGQISLNYGDIWGLEVEAAAANKLVKEDYTLHPTLKDKYKAGYLNMLARSKEASDKDLLSATLEKMLANTTPKESDLQIARDLYTRLKDNNKTAHTDSLLRAKFPQGVWVRGEQLAALVAATKGTQREELYKKFKIAFPPITKKDSSLFSNIASMIANLYLEEDNHTKALEYATLINSKRDRAYLYNSIARKLAGDSLHAKPIDAKTARELITLSLQFIGDEMSSASDKPAFYTHNQWKDMLKRGRAVFYDTYALLLYNLGDFQNAYASQQQAVADNNRTDIPMNETFAIYTEKVKGPAAARRELESFVKAGKASPAMKAQFKKLYLADNNTENQWTAYIAELEKDFKAKERTKLASEMLNIPAPAFALKDLAGNDVSLASLKGKIVVVDFWATWCGPCIASFPGMKMAVEKYQHDPDVQFVFIDTRESGDREKVKAAVTSFIEKNAWPFHVLLDSDNKAIEAYNVPGIPAKFVIDKNSIVRFKSIGYGGTAEELVDEMTIMIELTKTSGDDSKKGF